jgi:Effector-associated domain 11
VSIFTKKAGRFMHDELENIKQLIEHSDLEQAMDLFSTATRQIPDFQNQILLLQNRYNNYKKAVRGGLVDPLDKEVNNIASSLIDLVHEAEENLQEDTLLKNVGDKLQLTPVPGSKSKLFYKRFRTGEVFEMQVSLDMNTSEFKNSLIPTAMPNYLGSFMQRVFAFELMLLRTGVALDDGCSLRENGLQEKDTVYLRKFFLDNFANEAVHV